MRAEYLLTAQRNLELFVADRAHKQFPPALGDMIALVRAVLVRIARPLRKLFTARRTDFNDEKFARCSGALRAAKSR